MTLKAFLAYHKDSNEELQIGATVKPIKDWLISQVAIINDAMISIDLNASVTGRIYYLNDKQRWWIEWLS